LTTTKVSLSDLQRQVIGTKDVRAPKVGPMRSAPLDPHVTVESYTDRLSAANALDLISRYDIVADGSDNFSTRYLVANACFFAKKASRYRRSQHFRWRGDDAARVRTRLMEIRIRLIAACSRRRPALFPRAREQAISARSPPSWAR